MTSRTERLQSKVVAEKRSRSDNSKSPKVSNKKPKVHLDQRYTLDMRQGIFRSEEGQGNGLLYLCDNLTVMRGLPENFIDLIYMDPPFFTGKERKAKSRIRASEDSFEDTWTSDIDGYIEWLRPRLVETRRLLRSTGLIYLHLDWHAVHYVKVEMDTIFGYDRFINEIIWRYRTGGLSHNMFALIASISRNLDTSTASLDLSASIHCLPSFCATTPVVPDPQKKSATVSPGLVEEAIILSSSNSGF